MKLSKHTLSVSLFRFSSVFLFASGALSVPRGELPRADENNNFGTSYTDERINEEEFFTTVINRTTE
jgi:hypothetical protein